MEKKVILVTENYIIFIQTSNKINVPIKFHFIMKGCPKTSVRYYHSTLGKTQKEHRSHLTMN